MPPSSRKNSAFENPTTTLTATTTTATASAEQTAAPESTTATYESPVTWSGTSLASYERAIVGVIVSTLTAVTIIAVTVIVTKYSKDSSKLLMDGCSCDDFSQPWSEWSKCSTDFGFGNKTRTRTAVVTEGGNRLENYASLSMGNVTRLFRGYLLIKILAAMVACLHCKQFKFLVPLKTRTFTHRQWVLITSDYTTSWFLITKLTGDTISELDTTKIVSLTMTRAKGTFGPNVIWVLHIAKVGSIPSPYLGKMKKQKSWRWLFSYSQNSFIFYFCFGLKVSTDFPEFTKILCSFVTKTTIICFRKSWYL